MLLLPVFLFLGGCYDYKETDDIAIVSGIFISEGADEKYRLTFEIVETQADGSESPTPKLTEKDGKTIAEAIDNATAVSGKKLYFGHTQMLAIDYAMAQKGMIQIVDYFSRHNDMRLSMNMVIVKGMDGKTFFENAEQGSVASFAVTDILKANEERAITPSSELYNFIEDSFKNGKDAFLPVVTLSEDGNVDIDHVALFKDTVLIGELDKKNTKYMMILNNIKDKGGFLLERENEDSLSLEIRSRKTKIKPTLYGDKLYISVKLKAKYGITEMMDGDSVIKEESLRKIEREIDRFVVRELHGAIDNMRINNKSDPLGIENMLIRDNPGKEEYILENFSRLYEEAVLDIRSDSLVTDSGRTLRRLVKLR